MTLTGPCSGGLGFEGEPADCAESWPTVPDAPDPKAVLTVCVIGFEGRRQPLRLSERPVCFVRNSQRPGFRWKAGPDERTRFLLLQYPAFDLSPVEEPKVSGDISPCPIAFDPQGGQHGAMQTAPHPDIAELVKLALPAGGGLRRLQTDGTMKNSTGTATQILRGMVLSLWSTQTGCRRRARQADGGGRRRWLKTLWKAASAPDACRSDI